MKYVVFNRVCLVHRRKIKNVYKTNTALTELLLLLLYCLDDGPGALWIELILQLRRNCDGLVAVSIEWPEFCIFSADKFPSLSETSRSSLFLLWRLSVGQIWDIVGLMRLSCIWDACRPSDGVAANGINDSFSLQSLPGGQFWVVVGWLRFSCNWEARRPGDGVIANDIDSFSLSSLPGGLFWDVVGVGPTRFSCI